MITQDPDFPVCSDAYIYLENNPQKFAKINDLSLRNFVKKMLSNNPMDRPSASELLQEPFIKGWEMNLEFLDKGRNAIRFSTNEEILFYSAFFSNLSEKCDSLDKFDDLATLIGETIRHKNANNQLLPLIRECNIIDHFCSAFLEYFDFSCGNARYLNDSDDDEPQNEPQEKPISFLLKVLQLLELTTTDETKNIVAYLICSSNKLDIFIDLFKTKKELQICLMSIFEKLLSVSFFAKENKRFQLEPIIIRFIRKAYCIDDDDDDSEDDDGPDNIQELLNFYCKLPYHNTLYFTQFLQKYLTSGMFSEIDKIEKLTELFNNCKAFDKFDCMKPIINRVCESFLEGSIEKSKWQKLNLFFVRMYRTIIIDNTSREIYSKHLEQKAPAFTNDNSTLISPKIDEKSNFFRQKNFTTEQQTEIKWKCSVGLSSNGFPHSVAFSMSSFSLPNEIKSKSILFYYEIELIEMPKEFGMWSLGEIPFISIGVSLNAKKEFLSKKPTSFENEISYASNSMTFNDIDDNYQNSFSFPCFGSGDIVGCGMDYNRRIFFTLNGAFLCYASGPLENSNFFTCIRVHGQPTSFFIKTGKFHYNFNEKSIITYLNGITFIQEDPDLKNKVVKSLTALIERKYTGKTDIDTLKSFSMLISQDKGKEIIQKNPVSLSTIVTDDIDEQFSSSNVLNSSKGSSADNFDGDRPIFLFYSQGDNAPSTITVSMNMTLNHIIEILRHKSPNFQRLSYYAGEEQREINTEADLRMFFEEFLSSGTLPFITLE